MRAAGHTARTPVAGWSRRTRAETQAKSTHHRFADYYNVNTTQPIPTLTIYYHISTPKFPSHTVGVPPAGSFVRFKLLSGQSMGTLIPSWGWQQFAPFNKQGTFQQPYVLFKAKNIVDPEIRREKGVKKPRPIAPSTRHPMRKLPRAKDLSKDGIYCSNT